MQEPPGKEHCHLCRKSSDQSHNFECKEPKARALKEPPTGSNRRLPGLYMMDEERGREVKVGHSSTEKLEGGVGGKCLSNRIDWPSSSIKAVPLHPLTYLLPFEASIPLHAGSCE